jgi:acetyltransferase-like isoleucine patch superfamily enzyme
MLGRIRQRLRDEWRARGLAARTALAVQAPRPEEFASFGEGSQIVEPARVEGARFVEIGADVVIHEHFWLSVIEAVEGVTPRLRIGDHARIDRLVHIGCVGEIEIGPGVVVGERVLIGDTYHGYEDPGVPIIDQPAAPPSRVEIGAGAVVHAGAAILAGVTIGENAVIGVGAVVSEDVPPGALAVGNPAQLVSRAQR